MTTNEPVRLGFTNSDKNWLCLAGVVLGGLAGLLLPFAVHWAVGEGLPLPGWLEFLDSVEAGWLVWGRPLIGALAGLFLVFAIIDNSPVVTLSRAEVVVEKGQDRRRIPRDSVAGVHREGSKTIIETAEGRRLFEDEIEGGRDTVRQTFLDLGYPYESEPR